MSCTPSKRYLLWQKAGWSRKLPVFGRWRLPCQHPWCLVGSFHQLYKMIGHHWRLQSARLVRPRRHLGSFWKCMVARWTLPRLSLPRESCWCSTTLISRVSANSCRWDCLRFQARPQARSFGSRTWGLEMTSTLETRRCGRACIKST